jgi:hypothetical protein
MNPGLILRRALAPLTALTLLTCGGSSPTAVTPPVPPVTRPPATLPAATPPPTASGLCVKLGYTSTPDAKCSVKAPVFASQVHDAIDLLRQQHPEYFANDVCGIRVRDFGAYYVGVLANLNAAGLCPGFDGEEVQVKDSNNFSEQYKIWVSNGCVKQNDQYRSTCSPAAFPTPPPGTQPPPPGCQLPGSYSIACGDGIPQFSNDVSAAAAEVAQSHPELLDGVYVKDTKAYMSAVASALSAKGFCVKAEAYELGLKLSNDFSEQHAIITSNAILRPEPGAYRATCNPATF